MSRTGLSFISSNKNPSCIKHSYPGILLSSTGGRSMENTWRPLESTTEVGSDVQPCVRVEKLV